MLLDTIPVTYKIMALALVAYLVGSIPFGFLFGKMKGTDLRQLGSKNIGATNAGRVLGKKYFYIVLFLDAAKGFLPTTLAGVLLFRWDVPRHWLFFLWLLVAFCAIAGHNWPCWLKFKGGKGVATSLGVVLALYPYYTWPGLIAFGVWILVYKFSGFVSLGSIIAALVFLFSYLGMVILLPDWTFREQWPLVLFASAMIGVLILRHSGNIRRLCSGTENKL
jgi:acyl phosphate:glycerol-3-phosphate acyltransferase